ncbi:uncharacterized protein LOC113363241 [Ctenocephalides felis]|uniref:uncharacterized protein LOC113363241 n=1 Tax=Ctenocephalides felis TaxID=7515 RepID=UPI000E6E15F6|nr:uncharacterized protein LOC113363241 [Ctenocephalides felis]
MVSSQKVPLGSCCRCYTLRTGTIFSGVMGILLAVVALILMFCTSVEFKTITIVSLPSWIVKIILAINLAMTVLISVMLIIGAVKRNTFLMLPWVLLGILLAIGLLISIIYTAVMFFIDGNTLNGCLWLAFGIVSVIVYVYMWLVVFSYFQIVRQENEKGRYQQPYYRR